MGLFSFVRSFDTFRTDISDDLTESTKTGGVVTFTIYAFLGFLLWGQANEFLTVRTEQHIEVDHNTDAWLLVNFDIVTLDLPCEYATVSVKDVFGLERFNVTKDVEKIHLKIEGTEIEEGEFSVDEQVEHENENARAIELDRHGNHALEEQGKDELLKVMASHHLTLVLFFAPWCRWCQMLMPTFEGAAAKLDATNLGRSDIKVKLVTFNCAKYQEGCMHFRIRSFPTIYLFRGSKLLDEYNGHRTVSDMVEWLTPFAKDFGRHMPNQFHNLGCRLKGMLMVSRVPGNFHIDAHSETRNLAPSETNVSHIINHLSFGPVLSEELENRLPERERNMIHPLNGEVFLASEKHQAPQHYLKIATTQFTFRDQTWTSYTMSSTNRIRQYDKESVPSAKFNYDISAIRTTVSQRGTTWYHFLTNCLAIIGGAYTFVTMVWGGADIVKKKLLEGKQD